MTIDTIFAGSPRYPTAPQVLALLGGATCVGITAANLIGSTDGQLGLEQWTALAYLFGTICAGILGKVTWGLRKYGYSIVFTTVFVFGTALIIYTSVGGQHGTAAKIESEAKNANDALHKLQGEQRRIDGLISDLKKELRSFAGVPSSVEVQGKLDAIVGSRPGQVPANVWRRTKACNATETTKAESAEACKPAMDLRELNGRAIAKERLQRDVATLEVRRAQVVEKLEAAGGEKPVPVKARGFAEFAGLLGYSTEAVERVMSRLDKVMVALFLELMGVVGIEFGLAGLLHQHRPSRQAPQEARQRPIEAHPEPTPPAPTSPPTGRRKRLVRKDQARADVLEFRRPVAQRDLAERWNVGKSMVSMWMEEWEAEGIVHRTRTGRTVTVQAAPRLRAVA